METRVRRRERQRQETLERTRAPNLPEDAWARILLFVIEMWDGDDDEDEDMDDPGYDATCKALEFWTAPQAYTNSCNKRHDYGCMMWVPPESRHKDLCGDDCPETMPHGTVALMLRLSHVCRNAQRAARSIRGLPPINVSVKMLRDKDKAFVAHLEHKWPELSMSVRVKTVKSLQDALQNESVTRLTMDYVSKDQSAEMMQAVGKVSADYKAAAKSKKRARVKRELDTSDSEYTAKTATPKHQAHSGETHRLVAQAPQSMNRRGGLKIRTRSSTSRNKKNDDDDDDNNNSTSRRSGSSTNRKNSSSSSTTTTTTRNNDRPVANTTLRTLLLNSSMIQGKSGKTLGEAMSSFPALRTLDLMDNHLQANFAIQLAKSLPNLALHTLNLKYNHVSTRGCVALADALHSNVGLDTLDLGSNSIGPEGARALATVLCANRDTTLRMVSLGGNRLGDEGARCIAHGLARNLTLHKIDLGANGIGPQGVQYLSRALRINRTLEVFQLDFNPIGNVGAKFLGEAMKDNKTLEVLILGKNGMDSEGAKAIVYGLVSSRSPSPSSEPHRKTRQPTTGGQSTIAGFPSVWPPRQIAMRSKYMGDRNSWPPGGPCMQNVNYHKIKRALASTAPWQHKLYLRRPRRHSQQHCHN